MTLLSTLQDAARYGNISTVSIEWPLGHSTGLVEIRYPIGGFVRDIEAGEQLDGVTLQVASSHAEITVMELTEHDILLAAWTTGAIDINRMLHRPHPTPLMPIMDYTIMGKDMVETPNLIKDLRDDLSRVATQYGYVSYLFRPNLTVRDDMPRMGFRVTATGQEVYTARKWYSVNLDLDGGRSADMPPLIHPMPPLSLDVIESDFDCAQTLVDFCGHLRNTPEARWGGVHSVVTA